MPTLRRNLDTDIVMFLVFTSTDLELSVWPDTDMGFRLFLLSIHIIPWGGLLTRFRIREVRENVQQINGTCIQQAAN